ncbi:hypothetical protein CMQ_4318 [Grosmannia clavigera kw1407]|uniref:Uncharacterized protein n=1 Tax=Grosmannia clavigera (strain kw1407 / UAMH 11150) TaxID=655863 RepID=F0XTF6_GROCL|nr:uncharacterized protein CMQ_4318 [Grosmannia clavigera kw1407]EFW98466.1 hypothetical protein CMQ_4318 [Grosmannia clavigera kw1407]
MDVAAKQIAQLVQRVLPERPHHLSISPDIRYLVPSDHLWPKDSPLQFTTYVSEADRGVLLTRPFYDIQLQPDEDTSRIGKNAGNGNGNNKKSKPSSSLNSSSATSPLADVNSKGETKKKVSLKDYQNKLQKKLPGSPPDSAPDSGSKAAKLDTGRSRSTSTMASLPAGHRLPPKPDVNGDRKYNHSPSKSPKPLQSSGVSDSRKRPADTHETSRPHKRSRSDTSMSSDSPPAPSRFNQRPHNPPSPLDLNNRKEDRKRTTANGQSQHRSRDSSNNHAALPASRANGHHPQRTDDERERTPENDVINAPGSVPSLPPILSPLHFNPERDRESSVKRSRPTAAPLSKSASKTKSGKPDALPPLLSPTLPPIVEQELLRLSKPTINLTAAPRSNQELPVSSSSGKKPARPAPDREKDEEHKEIQAYREPQREPQRELLREPQRESHRESQREPPRELSREAQREPQRELQKEPPAQKRTCIVTLKYKKKNAKRVRHLLALQPTPMKAPSKRTERSLSVEDTLPPAPITKKRPVQSDNLAGDPSPSVSFKHPRTVAEKSISAARAPAAPATPLKATPMVRVTSNNSQVLTPNESASYTPRSAERPLTSQGDPASAAAVSKYRRRYDAYLTLGTKLKHDRDAIVKNRLPNGTTKLADGVAAPAPNLLPSEKRLVAALSLEMVMSYMIAFKAFNQSRHLERRGSDITVWERLMPHLAELRSHARQFRPIEALALQLRAIFFEQMLVAITSHEAQSVAGKLLKATKLRLEAWTDAQNSVDLVSDESMRVVVGPWLGVEDTVRAMLPVLRRWCDKENVAWEQELQLPDSQ